MKSENPYRTLSHCVATFDKRDKELIALKYKESDEWVEVGWSEYYSRICTLASSLHALGAAPGTKIALMSNTRWEWAALDHAILGIGGVVVPIYQTVTPEDLEFILNNSEAEFLFVENKSLLRNFLAISKNCPTVKRTICIDPLTETNDSYLSWNQFSKMGQGKKFSEEFKKKCQQRTPDDMASILYTSGTTGQPKGVVLTHAAIISEVSEAFPYCGARKSDISLSFLPYAHVFGRVEHWGQAYIGFTLSFAESLEKIRGNLNEIRPTLLFSVPRIFEKIYAAVQTQFETNLATRNISKWAVGVGLKVGEYRLRKAAVPLPLALEYEAARRLVLSKVKEAFGGRLRFAISGGAPLSKEIALFFHACDVLVLEGYGLTETTAAICVNTPFDYHYGSVGKPIGETQIRIADDGEILVQSQKVMREYYKDPEGTKEAFTDRWFHTGDIGEWTDSGDLKITDRKKDLIKTAGGKYVAPQRLENLLKTHPFISNVLIHGDQRKYIVALITLDKPWLLNLAKEKNISFSDYESLTQNPQVQELVRKAVAETNEELANYETIKRFAVLPVDFTVEAGELTPSLKIKRKVLDRKYGAKIEALYN